MDSSWSDLEAFGLLKLRIDLLFSQFFTIGWLEKIQEEELQDLQVRVESDQGYKNFCYFVNHHCKHQVILLKTTLIGELLKYWYLVNHSSTSALLNLFPPQASLSPEPLQLPSLGAVTLFRQSLRSCSPALSYVPSAETQRPGMRGNQQRKTLLLKSSSTI